MKKNDIWFVIYTIFTVFVIISCSDSTEPKKKVAAPRFDPPGGVYEKLQVVYISCETPSALIRFTIDGSEPDEFSEIFTEGLIIDKQTTVKAVGFRDGWRNSGVVTEEYVIDLIQVDTPVFKPSGGVYDFPVQVQIVSGTEGTDIFYTLDGSEPTSDAILYEDFVYIGTSAVLKARAYKENLFESDITEDYYEIIYYDQPYVWVDIESGNFTWGLNNDIVNMEYDYQIMKYEVTNLQYLRFLIDSYNENKVWVEDNFVKGYYEGDHHYGSGVYNYYALGDSLFTYNTGRIIYDEGFFKVAAPEGFSLADFIDHPVSYVTWFGARAFADNYGWRLPTVKEWEKAARGMTGYDYPFGDSISGDQANYLNSGDPWDNGTTPVGYYNGINQGTLNSPSPYNVYDMAGNVANWCDSWLSETTAFRILKGGSFSNNPESLRSWLSSGIRPGHTSSSVGFRCVK